MNPWGAMQHQLHQNITTPMLFFSPMAVSVAIFFPSWCQDPQQQRSRGYLAILLWGPKDGRDNVSILIPLHPGDPNMAGVFSRLKYGRGYAAFPTC